MIYSDARVVAPKLLRARGGRKATLASVLQPLARFESDVCLDFCVKTKLPRVIDRSEELASPARPQLPPSRPRLFTTCTQLYTRVRTRNQSLSVLVNTSLTRARTRAAQERLATACHKRRALTGLQQNARAQRAVAAALSRPRLSQQQRDRRAAPVRNDDRRA